MLYSISESESNNHLFEVLRLESSLISVKYFDLIFQILAVNVRQVFTWRNTLQPVD